MLTISGRLMPELRTACSGLLALESVSPQDAQPYDCRSNAVRDPRETKGLAYQATRLPEAGCCEPDDGCC